MCGKAGPRCSPPRAKTSAPRSSTARARRWRWCSATASVSLCSRPIAPPAAICSPMTVRSQASKSAAKGSRRRYSSAMACRCSASWSCPRLPPRWLSFQSRPHQKGGRGLPARWRYWASLSSHLWDSAFNRPSAFTRSKALSRLALNAGLPFWNGIARSGAWL